MKKISIQIPDGLKPRSDILEKASEFIATFVTFENKNKMPHLLLFDKKSETYYLLCHLDSEMLSKAADIDAVLDPFESEDYKLNRDIYTDTYAYKFMQSDALKGRSFEDIVVEYDTSYRATIPLKVFGGQHRITAIKESYEKGVMVPHGVRVYFGLTTEQRYDIANANNTSIAVSNDLLDRMQEDMLGTHLRDWCQSVDLLEKGKNFADRRNPDGIITVRIARTLVVNFYRGKKAKHDDFHMPVVCTSGKSVDKNYLEVREAIDWTNKGLFEMGKYFSELHKTQRQKVLNRDSDKHLEFAHKAIHPTVAASWSYASGLFQVDVNALKKHYSLAVVGGPKDDPLSAKTLSQARLKATDPDTYRGLGARINNEELGRMFAVFLLQATKASKPGINLKLANAAIVAYQSAKLKAQEQKALKGI